MKLSERVGRATIGGWDGEEVPRGFSDWIGMGVLRLATESSRIQPPAMEPLDRTWLRVRARPSREPCRGCLATRAASEVLLDRVLASQKVALYRPR